MLAAYLFYMHFKLIFIAICLRLGQILKAINQNIHILQYFF